MVSWCMSVSVFQDFQPLLMSEYRNCIVISLSYMLVTFSFVNPFLSNSLKILYLLAGRVDEGSLSKYLCI